MTPIGRAPIQISAYSNAVSITGSNSQKVAFAPVAIGWYAANAVWINPLVYTACAGLGAWAIHNIFKALNNEPQESLTAIQVKQLAQAKANIARDPRFKTAPADIQENLGINSSLDTEADDKIISRLLYKQALKKSLINPRLTPEQRADLMALENYIFKAEDTKSNDEGKNAGTQNGKDGSRITAKLKKPKKPKLPKVSKPVVDKIGETANNLWSTSRFRELFNNPQALPQIKQMLEISKLTFTSKIPVSVITNMERFILLAEKNFFSGRAPNAKEVMDMAVIAAKLGWH